MATEDPTAPGGTPAPEGSSSGLAPGGETGPAPAPAPASGLGPHVVGTRVVVRRLLRGQAGPTGGPAMTDVLGVCLSWPDHRDGDVVVLTEGGERVAFPRADVVAGKPVPPRPDRHQQLDPAEADRRADAGWPALETEDRGGWRLRASQGYTNRGNSVLALGPPPGDAARAVADVEAWYAGRGLRPQAHVLPGDPGDLALRAAGWEAYEHTVLMLGSLARIRRRCRALGGEPPAAVDLSPRLDDGWLATDDRTRRQEAVARRVLELREGQEAVWFATVREEGRVLARGRGVVHDDWLGLASLWTDPDRRGQGLGRAVTAALLDAGAETGASTVYLQVVTSNDSARRLYRDLTLRDHHTYDYLAPAVSLGT